MSEYIKREDAISILQRYIFEHGFYCDTDADKHYTAELVDSLLSSVPAADVVERKEGRWIERAYATTYDICGLNKKVGWGCSECGLTWDARTHYCPGCGARMESEK